MKVSTKFQMETDHASKPASFTEWDILKRCYVLVSALSTFMVFWILIIPSSWLIGRWEWHDRQIIPFLRGDGIVTPTTLTKFAGHTAVHLTHILPGALWAGIIPFQLHSEWRKKYRRAHRYSGYLFFASSFTIMIGFILILKRGLLFENSFPDLPPHRFPGTLYGLTLTSLWFTTTAIMALTSARNKRFLEHQEWIYRHIASGIWVALQRVLLVGPLMIIFPAPVSRMRQRALFGDSATAASVVCYIVAEYCIHLQRQINKKRQLGVSTKQGKL